MRGFRRAAVNTVWQGHLLVWLALSATGCIDRSPCGTAFALPDGGEPVAFQPTLQARKFANETTFSWSHFVADTGSHHLLLVVCNTDAASLHPVSVTVDGVELSPAGSQDAPSYGALSVWSLAAPGVGTHLIEVAYSQSAAGLARSISFENVAPEGSIQNVGGGTHSGSGSATVVGTPLDLPLMVVSWGNTQSTRWLNGELELWDDTDPGPNNSLGGAAATQLGGSVVEFAWEATSGSSSSGAHLGLSVRAFSPSTGTALRAD